MSRSPLARSVQGTVDINALTEGYPVLMGGQRIDGTAQYVRLDTNNNMLVAVDTSAGAGSSTTPTDNMPQFSGSPVISEGMVYNGANVWSRMASLLQADTSPGTGTLAAGLAGWDATGAVVRKVLVDTAGRLLTSGPATGGAANGVQSTVNQTDTPLGNGGVFTGGFENLALIGYPSAIEVSVATDVSYLNTGQNVPPLQLQWSRDGVNIDVVDGAYPSTDTPFGVVGGGLGQSVPTNPANTGAPSGLRQTFSFPAQNFDFLRVVYTNGTTPQTVLHVRTLYRYNPTERGLGYRYSSRYGQWVPQYCNECFTLLSSAASAVIRSTGKRVNYQHIGAILSLGVTVMPATPAGLDLSLEVSYDGSTFIRINAPLTGAFITTTGTFVFLWHPNANNLSTGLSANTAKQTLGYPLPLFWQARVLPQDGQSYTYSLQAAFIVQ